jgi:chaperonin GroES
MLLKPLRNQLFVKRAESEEKVNGIWIPDKAQKKASRGTVVAAGAGYRSETGAFIENTIRSGDVVLWSEGSGVEVIIDGEKLVVISEDIVIAVVDP